MSLPHYHTRWSDIVVVFSASPAIATAAANNALIVLESMGTLVFLC